jgi:hypothetical protein|tara:strand:- start:6123 stop:6578 length:456 start_codon:yes stop_codon:yes gene_type:complete
MNKIYFFAFLLSLFSCSPIYRHQKLVEKYPFVHTQDTILLTDTISITVPEVKHDTVFSQHYWTEIRKDTLFIEKERLTIKIFHDTIKDSIFVSGKCDTVYKQKIITKKIPIRYYSKKSDLLKWIIIVAVISLLFLAICKAIKTERNENKSN